MEKGKLAGFELIKEYPGSPAKGTRVVYHNQLHWVYEKSQTVLEWNHTNGREWSVAAFETYSEFWKPIYEEPEFKKKYGDKQIEVTIKDGKIFADNTEFFLEGLKDVLLGMEYYNSIARKEYNIISPSIIIGCCTFSRQEIEEIINEAEKQLNK